MPDVRKDAYVVGSLTTPMTTQVGASKPDASSPAPKPTPIPWQDSKVIRYLFVQWFAGMLLQVSPMLQTHTMDWWALGAQSVATLAAVLFRMAQPDVIAPAAVDAALLGAMNRNTQR